MVLERNENTKRASWWAIFGGKAGPEGTPNDGQKESRKPGLTLKRTHQNERQLFGFSHDLEAREKQIPYFLLI